MDSPLVSARAFEGPATLGRRQFLIASGVLGAAAVYAGANPAGFAAALASSPTDTLAPVLATLALDTMGGLVSFVVPGPDAFSIAQGQAAVPPGGVAAGAPAFMINALDNFLPLPQELIRPLIDALVTASGGSLPVGGGLLGGVLGLAGQIDQALAPILQGQGTAPLSLPVAMLLNLIASNVDPLAVAGNYLDSPFANLSDANKGEVFRRLEEDTTMVAAMLDSNIPEPLHDSLSGVIGFVSGALLEFSAFGAFNEWNVLDPTTRQLESVPIGWRDSGYLAQAGFTTVEGWDELLGYFQGRKKVIE